MKSVQKRRKAMNFTPCTEQEIADRKLWAKAVYAFEIIEAAEKVSQQGGNPMIELKLRITRPDGFSRVITDYLVEKRIEKLRNALRACGLLDRYEAGSVTDSDFRGKRGKLKLGIEKGKNGYPDKNVVTDYVCDGAGSPESGFFARATV
jgi:hypothetical protein